MSDTSVVTAAQLMSSPVVGVTADHSLAAAWEAMRERQLHHLVVLDEYGLAAVLDDRTLVAHWPVGGPEAAHLHRVGDIVRHGVRCVLPEAPATDAACIMAADRCDAVPVVTAGGVVLGLLTAADVVAGVARGAIDTLLAARPLRDGRWEHGNRG